MLTTANDISLWQVTATTAAIPPGRYKRRGLTAIIHAYTAISCGFKDEHPTLTFMAMGGKLDVELFSPDAWSASVPGIQLWKPRLDRIVRESLPSKQTKGA
jgi:hypothetical protein